jgi:hypothetical protein
MIHSFKPCFLVIVYTESNWGFLLWVPFVFLLLYGMLKNYQAKILQRFASNQAIEEAGKSFKLFWLRAFAITFSALFAVIALMQPEKRIELISSQKEQALTAKSPLDEIVFLVDVSASMQAKDAQGQNSSRLDRAKEFAESIIERLGGINISVYAFAGNVKEVVPETMDYLYSRMVLDGLEINQTGKAGTDFASLFNEMKKQYLESNIRKKVAFILLSDGEDTGILGLVPDARTEAESQTLEILKNFAGKMGWYVIGIGTDNGSIVPGVSYNGKDVISSMHRGFLEAIGQITSGKSYFDEQSSLSEIIDDLLIGKVFKTEGLGSEALNEQVEPLYYYPLLFAIVLLLVALLLPEKITFPERIKLT